MRKTEAVRDYSFADVETLVFAGGGNRCWWQAGALAHFMRHGLRLPARLIGTSAGAAVAASCMTPHPEVALQACLALYADNRRAVEWSGLSTRRLKFAHQRIYPAWVDSSPDITMRCGLRMAGLVYRGYALPRGCFGVRGRRDEQAAGEHGNGL